MRVKSLVFIAGVVILAAGCGGPRTIQPTRVYQPTPVVKVSPDEVVQDVREANRQYEIGNYRAAIRKYDELMSMFKSEGGKLETAILTNLALSCLEDGDRRGFLLTADRLAEVSRGATYLSHESQVVLTLRKLLAPSVNHHGGDPRVERKITDSVHEMFNVRREKGGDQ